MSSIGANDATVYALTRPIRKIKSPYVLVPVVFLIGNVLSLVVPSASNLAIILLATLYPVLRKAGMSPLTAAGIIATTATIMPTPLGSDNVAIAEELAKYPEYAGLTVTEYVLQYHAMVSIPTLIIMAVIHLFWQRFCDKRDSAQGEVDNAEGKDLVIEGSMLRKTVYAILPMLPIFLLIAVYLMQVIGGSTFSLSVEVATLFSFLVALICDAIFNRNPKDALGKSEGFFKGMGGTMPVVALTVAARRRRWHLCRLHLRADGSRRQPVPLRLAGLRGRHDRLRLRWEEPDRDRPPHVRPDARRRCDHVRALCGDVPLGAAPPVLHLCATVLPAGPCPLGGGLSRTI